MNLLKGLLTLIAVAIVVAPSAGKPSFFEETKTSSDLDQLEDLLTGKRSHVEDPEGLLVNSNVVVGKPPGAASPYEPPYLSLFQNDSIFGEFRKELEHPVPPQVNSSWVDLFLGGDPFLNMNASGSHALGSSSGRAIKPILVKEPTF